MGDITLMIECVSEDGSVRRVVSGRSARDIVEKCVDLFVLEGTICIEVFDKRFEEYVIVDECDFAKTLVDGSKLRIKTGSTVVGGGDHLRSIGYSSTIQVLDAEGGSSLDISSVIFKAGGEPVR